MAINNINALVDLEGLEKLNNSDYVKHFYNTALANQGQRWTNEKMLEYLSFNLTDLISSEVNLEGYTHIALKGDIILDENETELIQISSIENIKFYYSNGESFSNEVEFNEYDENTIEYVVFNKKKNIIENLYRQVILDLDKDGFDIVDSENNVIDNQILFIPLEYNFEYVSDGINKSIIYGSNKNIYIYVEPELVYNTNSQTHIGNEVNDIPDSIIFIKKNIKNERTYVYGFSFEFGNNNSIVSRNFILPYIDNDNYWVVNGRKTEISAKAENAVGLNIILAYLYKVGNSPQFKVLSGLSDYVQTDNILEEREIWIKRHNGKIFSIKVNIPNITLVETDIINHPDNDKRYTSKSIVDLLKNSSILLMTRLTKLIADDDIKKEYQDGLITTIWTYNVNTQKYEYVSIEQKPDEDTAELRDIALNFGDITNFSNLINYTVANIEQIVPDNYVYRHLIFEQILKTNKQEISETTAYPVLQNIQGSEYNNKYGNNFNFTLRYVNSINGDLEKHTIDKPYNNTTNKYLKTGENDIMNLITNSLYKTVSNNQTIYYPEYVPNYDVPTFDLSEVLVKDFNVVNRQNIISFAPGKIYYSYIGTSFKDTDKNILHIGSYSYNINLGDYSLINSNERGNFSIQDTLSIDFKYSYINSYLYVQDDLSVKGNIYFEKINWNYSKINNVDIYSTQIVPKFKYILNPSTNAIYYDINVDNMNNHLLSIYDMIKTRDEKTKYTKEYLYLNIILSNKINNIDYYYKYNDLLYIPNLLRYIELDEIQINNITSETNQIIYDDEKKPIFFVSSNNMLSNSINITAANDTNISINIQSIKDLYIGNTLDIIHTIKNGVHELIINEHKSHKIRSIWKLPNQIKR